MRLGTGGTQTGDTMEIIRATAADPLNPSRARRPVGRHLRLESCVADNSNDIIITTTAEDRDGNRNGTVTSGGELVGERVGVNSIKVADVCIPRAHLIRLIAGIIKRVFGSTREFS